MILEVWELTGYVVGQKKKVFTSILIHLAFRHLFRMGTRDVNAWDETFFQK